MRRLYQDTPLQENSELQLSGDAHHYISRVLRCRTHDSVVLFNGDGYDYWAKIIAISKKELTLQIEKRQVNNCQSMLKIVLIQGLSKGEKMDFVMQKATELGVSEILPVITEHNAVKLDPTRTPKKHQHWQSIIQSAAEQCGRAELPKLHPLTELTTALPKQTCEAKVVFTPTAATSIKSMTPPSSVAFLMGLKVAYQTMT